MWVLQQIASLYAEDILNAWGPIKYKGAILPA